MKVFWLSNRFFTETPDSSTGTWITAMGRALVESGQVQLANISQDKVKTMMRRDCKGVTQWVVPYEKLGRNGLPSRRTIDGIKRAVEEFAPDLIHIWGIENYWGLLTARKILRGKALLEIQGFKYACAKVFYGGLTFSELLQCIGPKELIKPSISLQMLKHRFQTWGIFEEEIIQGHPEISTQSDWTRARIAHINPDCKTIKIRRMLRTEFMTAAPWAPAEVESQTNFPTIFTSCGCSNAYKGLHVLIRAVAIVKKQFPGVVLNVAGYTPRGGIRKGGYERFVEHEVHRLGLAENFRWLGALDASGLIREMRGASAVVVPSFVESYSLALAEALHVGVPCVVSYAGAMPELAKHEESALFFPAGDEAMCAWQIMKIFKSPSLALYLSKNALFTRASFCNAEEVLDRQIEVYKEVIASCHI